jgi:transcriptional regulator with XRE-family HTH domain
MAKPFSKLLGEYRTQQALTQREMAAILGMSDRMYAYYEKGDYDGQPARIKKYLDKLAYIKETGIRKKTATSTKTGLPTEVGTPVYEIPATAGQMDHISQLPEEPSYRVSIPGYEDCNFGMYVYGHSMYPTIESGSLVLCRKIIDKSVIMYGEIYLVRTADYLMVKRLQKSDRKGHVLCTSDNFEQRSEKFKRFEPFDVPVDKILDLYIVKGIIKKTQL